MPVESDAYGSGYSGTDQCGNQRRKKGVEIEPGELIRDAVKLATNRT